MVTSQKIQQLEQDDGMSRLVAVHLRPKCNLDRTATRFHAKDIATLRGLPDRADLQFVMIGSRLKKIGELIMSNSTSNFGRKSKARIIVPGKQWMTPTVCPSNVHLGFPTYKSLNGFVLGQA
jgi:hypothetical protein